MSSDRRIGIIAQTLSITHREQKQVQSLRLVVQAAEMLIPYQAMIHPTELFGNTSKPLGAKYSLRGHFYRLLPGRFSDCY
jgi:hypothetical protein